MYITGFFLFARVPGPCLSGTSLNPLKVFDTQTKHSSLLPAPPLISISPSFNGQMWEMGLTGVERIENDLKGRVILKKRDQSLLL